MGVRKNVCRGGGAMFFLNVVTKNEGAEDFWDIRVGDTIAGEIAFIALSMGVQK